MDDEEDDAGGGAGRHHPLAEEEAGPDAGALGGNDQALTDHLEQIDTWLLELGHSQS